jgi:hypothetical protein
MSPCSGLPTENLTGNRSQSELVCPRDVFVWASDRFPQSPFSLEDFASSIQSEKKGRDDSRADDLPIYAGGVTWTDALYDEKLRSTLVNQRDPPDDEMSSRVESGYLKTIGALLRLLLDKDVGGKRAVFQSQASVIAAIEQKFPQISGLSKRELEDKFAQANKSLTTD